MNAIYLLLLLSAVWNFAAAVQVSDMSEVCGLVKSGTKLASTLTNAGYYACQDNVASFVNCPTGYVFSKNQQVCMHLTGCESIDTGFVPGAQCNEYYYCEKGQKKGTGYCPINTSFVDGECRYQKCTTSTNNSPSADVEDFQSICEIMPINIFFGDKVNCDGWHKCVKNSDSTGENLVNGECGQNLNYNAAKGSCVYDDNVCERVNGDPIIPGDSGSTNAPSCSTDNAKVPHPSICSKYFKCVQGTADANGQPTYTNVLQTCKVGQYFNDVTGHEGCVERSKATPCSTCDRCEYSNMEFVNIVEASCTQYQRCVNNRKEGPVGECSSRNGSTDNIYLNEAMQSCVVGVIPTTYYSWCQ